MPKPEEDLDSESTQEHSRDLPEQSSDISADESSSEPYESSTESYTVDKDEGSEELSSEEETETAPLAERAPKNPNEVLSVVVLGEGNSQISESSYQTALASSSSAELSGVADTVEDHDNIEDDMQKCINANCSEK